MNCMVIEDGEDIVVIDCGLMFSDLDHFGVQFVIPDFAYLVENKDRIRGIILTHGHEDHIGALPFLIQAGVRAPLYATEFTAKLIANRFREYNSDPDLRVFAPGDVVSLGAMSFTSASVNHSIVDAVAIALKTSLGTIVHTGDFRIDPMPFYGSELDSKFFKKLGDEGVLLLMSDSTNVDRCELSLTENRVYQKFEELFAAAQGMTIVALFASNVARMGQIFEIAAKQGKKVAIAGRSMDQNTRLGEECGYLEHAPQVLIPIEDLKLYERDQLIVLSGGSQAELGSALQRIAAGEHRFVKLQKGDRVLMSSRHIPGNEKPISRMLNQLFEHGADVLYEAMHEIHASGHATRPELKRMLEWVRPQYFLPVHGEFRHLVRHGQLAQECGMSEQDVLVVRNGSILELEPDRFEKVDEFDDPRIWIESREGIELTRQILKERRQMAETGLVFVLLSRSRESGDVLSGPQIISKGLVNESMEGWMIEEAGGVARQVVQDYRRALEGKGPPMDLSESVRIEVRRFLHANLGKKPVVVPMILEV